MNNYIDMNDVEQLIINKLTGQIGEEEDERLSGLIIRHHEVEHLWQQMQQVYAMRKAVSFDQSFNAEDAWQALQQRVNIPEPVPQPVTDTVAMPVRSAGTHWLKYSMAAAITGIIVLAVLYFNNINRPQLAANKSIEIKLANGSTVHAAAQDSLSKWMQTARDAQVDPVAWNTLKVPAGKSYSFQLADGSRVWLNAASEFRFPLLFTRSSRAVELQGEAYFKIVHRDKQPFTVQVNGLTVTALGTAFNIRSYAKENTSISLIQGSVSVANALGEQLILSPGEGVIVTDRNSRLRKETFDETTVLGWLQGVYYFRNEKLQQIALVAERWFGIHVQLKEESLEGLHFSGAMDRNLPVASFFNMLASSGDIRYQVVEDKVIISRN